jgi:prepilin-type processing-associated H-X9-DG protein
VYNKGPGAPVVAGGTAETPKRGYTHWSWFIYNTGRKQGVVSESAFICPSLPFEGGLPPTNPAASDMVPGQVKDPNADQDVVDNQVRRCAYTVNEAVCSRNKFAYSVRNDEGPILRRSQYVKASRIKKVADVILATEFHESWKIVSVSDDGVCKSHRPVHGFQKIGGSEYDLNSIGTINPNFVHRPFELAVAPSYPPLADRNRLSWIGRNHGSGARARTNFLYCDGHVETKTIEQTLENPRWQWGTKVYSLEGEPLISGVPSD